MARSLVHLNGNLLCAIDVETTGSDPTKHEVYELAVIPLDSQIQPIKTILPLHMYIKPGRCWEDENGKIVGVYEHNAIRLNYETFRNALRIGHDPFDAIDLFEKWFVKLKLPYNKRIAPLGHNYPFDQAFIEAWMGKEHYKAFFFHYVRDTMVASLFLNDYADFNAEPVPFPKSNLSYLCATLKIENAQPHSALYDALASAEVWRKMILRGDII